MQKDKNTSKQIEDANIQANPTGLATESSKQKKFNLPNWIILAGLGVVVVFVLVTWVIIQQGTDEDGESSAQLTTNQSSANQEDQTKPLESDETIDLETADAEVPVETKEPETNTSNPVSETPTTSEVIQPQEPQEAE